MQVCTTMGEIVTISQKNIIWNALYDMCNVGSDKDEVFLSLYPKHESIRVSRDQLRSVVDTFISQYS